MFHTILMNVVAGGAALVFVLVGLFSVVSLLWDDLLESDRDVPSGEFSRAA